MTRHIQEMEQIGSVLLRCIDVARKQSFYRPERPFQFKRKKKPGKPNEDQLAFKFPEVIRSTEQPLIDLFPEAYR